MAALLQVGGVYDHLHQLVATRRTNTPTTNDEARVSTSAKTEEKKKKKVDAAGKL